MCLSPADMDVASLKRHIKHFKDVTKYQYKDKGFPVPDYRKRHLAMLKEALVERKAEEAADQKIEVQPRHVNSTWDLAGNSEPLARV